MERLAANIAVHQLMKQIDDIDEIRLAVNVAVHQLVKQNNGLVNRLAVNDAIHLRIKVQIFVFHFRGEIKCN